MKRTTKRTSTIKRLAVVAVLSGYLAAPLPSSAEEPAATQSADEAPRLIASLDSDASTFVKAKACYRLAAIGDEKAVPALAKLLNDPELSNYGRHGLERIGGDEAKKALRDAISEAKGELLVGVIGSVGHLRDEAAIGQLTSFLKGDDQTVAMAAARSLGRIGTPKAAVTLLECFKAVSKDGSQLERDAIGKGCLICARKMAPQEENAPLVLQLCEAVRNSDVSFHVRLSALHTAIVLRGENGGELLRELLRSDDWSQFQVAMHAARELKVDVTKELVAQFDKRAASEQAIMLGVLGEAASNDAIATIQKASQQGDSAVRIKAFEALGKYPDDAAVAWLLAAVFDADAKVAEAARTELVRRPPSKRIDATVLEMLGDSDKVRLLVAVDLAKRRLLHEAAPRLWELSEHEDNDLRIAALHSLGTTTGVSDWPRLIRVATAEDESDERRAARFAAKHASGRITRAGSSKMVGRALEGASSPAMSYLFDLLGHIGGPDSLQVVVAAAKSGDEAKVDAATRVLGNWMSADVAPALYELTTTLADRKYKIRTLRGYIRVARHLSMSVGDRLDLCEQALKVADRSEEKLLVLDVLRVRAVPRGMRIARGMLDDKDSEVMEQAARVIVIVARGYVREFPAHAEEALVPALALAKNDRVQLVGNEILQQAQELLRERKSE